MINLIVQRKNNRIKVLGLFIVLLILIISFTIEPVGDVLNSNIYPQNIAQNAPKIIYNNSTNYYLWNTKLNLYKDHANTNLTSIWSSGIYADDNGNLFWTDTFGHVIVKWDNSNYYYYLGTPYDYFPYAGQITSIAAINYTLFFSSNIIQEVPFVVLLTYDGYVFGYNLHDGYWFNATSFWNLPLTQYPGPWTSVTSNVEGYVNNYDEGFFFTNFYGDTYFFDTTYYYSLGLQGTNLSGWYIKSNSEKNIIATAAYYNYSLYGISYKGIVYVALSNNSWGIYDNTNIHDLIGITIGRNNHIYLLELKNGTSLDRSSNVVGSINGGFSPYGNKIFSKGTSGAITFDQSTNRFWIIQTNGTIANSIKGEKWTYLDNLLFIEEYPTILAINSTYSLSFNAYSILYSYKNLTNILNFTLYFNGSNDNLQMEYNYQYGLGKNYSIPVILDSSAGILINVTLRPNMAYNSKLYFYVYFYPQNEPNGLILVYDLNITIINHFNYIPIT